MNEPRRHFTLMHETRHHYHRDDRPRMLALLDALLASRRDAADLGYEPTETGAWIDFDVLCTTGRLSTTERATALAAKGLGRIEAHGGGVPHHLRIPLLALVEEVTR